MSYLGLPRIHFAGAFFTNPGNLNNDTTNYEKAADGQPLVYETGKYNNPKGVAQYYLRACVVTQVIGADGQPVANDPLLGAAVNSVNPWDAQTGPDGKNYTLAKIADLDPNMQFRSELYGLRLFVASAAGHGFSGAVQVPQLRDLFFGRTDAGIAGLQVACGTWHQRLVVDRWSNPSANASPVLALLSAGGANALDIKLSVDMFQTDPTQLFTTGNMYCYGRMLGTIGAVSAGMPNQVVPGRRLYAVPSSSTAPRAVAATATPILTRQDAEKVAAPSADTPLWNNTDARVVAAGNQSYLLVDMGTSTPLNTPSRGSFACSELQLGYLQAGQFVPFTTQGYTSAGRLVSVTAQLADYIALPDAAAYRDSVYPRNAGVVQLALSSSESQALRSCPLGIRSDGMLTLQENSNGYYVNSEAASCRLQPKQTLADAQQSINLVVHCFGQPATAIDTPESVSLVLSPQLVVYDASGTSSTQPTQIFNATLATEPAAGLPGQFRLALSTGPGQSLTDNRYRRPMDSLLCFLGVTSPQCQVGENPGSPKYLPYIPMVSLLFWQNQWLVATPTWKDDIQPILGVYARLYPGMAGLLDIGDEATVKANALGIMARLSLAVADPGFMPVVRDMSPGTINMLNGWLKQQAELSAKAVSR